MPETKEITVGQQKYIKEDSNDIVSRVVSSLPTPDIFSGDLHNLYKGIAVGSKTEGILTINSNGFMAIAKDQGSEAQPTNQSVRSITSQVVTPPIAIGLARSLKEISSHHASCIKSKLYATVGLGFVSDGDGVEDSKNTDEDTESKIVSLLTGERFVEAKADKLLNPLCIEDFSLEFHRSIEDYLDGGTGYLEVVRENNNIVGINWLPYEDIAVSVVRDREGKGRIVYKYQPTIGIGMGTIKYYSMFGLNNRTWVFDNFYKDITDRTIDSVSEVIAFKDASNMSRYYGYPDWLSAAALVTLVGLAVQYKSDFYTNRGVLAYILSVFGELDTGVWEKIEAKVQGSVGAGNNFRNLALQFTDKEAKVQLDKLTVAENTEIQFGKDMEALAQNIVSAHRVPPVLANILIPGKLGAANEGVQAIVSFQLLNIGPRQVNIQQTLARTLGDSNEGVKGLGPEDFRFRKITSQFNIVGLDTVANSKEEAITATNADGSKRDMSKGPKE